MKLQKHYSIVIVLWLLGFAVLIVIVLWLLGFVVLISIIIIITLLQFQSKTKFCLVLN